MWQRQARDARTRFPHPLHAVAFEAFAQAGGVLRSTQATATTGAFVGAASSGYGELVARAAASPSAHHAAANSLSVIAGRLAFAYDLRGPALVVETACSSSLLAVALAHRALRDGELGTALAAGLHVQALPQSTAYVGAAAMLSPQGR